MDLISNKCVYRLDWNNTDLTSLNKDERVIHLEIDPLGGNLTPAEAKENYTNFILLENALYLAQTHLMIADSSYCEAVECDRISFADVDFFTNALWDNNPTKAAALRSIEDAWHSLKNFIKSDLCNPAYIFHAFTFSNKIYVEFRMRVLDLYGEQWENEQISQDIKTDKAVRAHFEGSREVR